MEQIYYTQCPMGYGLGASNGFQVKRISEGYPVSADFRHLGMRPYPGGGRVLAPRILRYRRSESIAEVACLTPRTSEYETERGPWGRPGGHFAHGVRLTPEEQRRLGHWYAGLMNAAIWVREDRQPSRLVGMEPPPLELTPEDFPIPADFGRVACLAAGLDVGFLARILASLADAVREGRSVYLIDAPDRLGDRIALLTFAFPSALRSELTFSTFHDRPEELPGFRIHGTSPFVRPNRTVLLSQGRIVDVASGTCDPPVDPPEWATRLAGWFVSAGESDRAAWEVTDAFSSSLSIGWDEVELDALFSYHDHRSLGPAFPRVDEDWSRLSRRAAWVRERGLGQGWAAKIGPEWWDAASPGPTESARETLRSVLRVKEAWRPDLQAGWGRIVAQLWTDAQSDDRESTILEIVRDAPREARALFLREVSSRLSKPAADSLFLRLQDGRTVEPSFLLPLRVPNALAAYSEESRTEPLQKLLAQAHREPGALAPVLDAVASEAAKRPGTTEGLSNDLVSLFAKNTEALAWALRRSDGRDWMGPCLRRHWLLPGKDREDWRSLRDRTVAADRPALARIFLAESAPSSTTADAFVWGIEELLLEIPDDSRPFDPSYPASYLDKIRSDLLLFDKIIRPRPENARIRDWLESMPLSDSHLQRLARLRRLFQALKSGRSENLTACDLAEITPSDRPKLLGNLLAHGKDNPGAILAKLREDWPELVTPGHPSRSAFAARIAGWSELANRVEMASLWFEAVRWVVDSLGGDPREFGPDGLAAEILSATAARLATEERKPPWGLRQWVFDQQSTWKALSLDLRRELRAADPERAAEIVEEWDRRIVKPYKVDTFWEIVLNSCDGPRLAAVGAAHCRRIRDCGKIPWWLGESSNESIREMREAFCALIPMAPLPAGTLAGIRLWLEGSTSLAERFSVDSPLPADPVAVEREARPVSEARRLRFKCVETLTNFVNDRDLATNWARMIRGWALGDDPPPIASTPIDDRRDFLESLCAALPELPPNELQDIARQLVGLGFESVALLREIRSSGGAKARRIAQTMEEILQGRRETARVEASRAAARVAAITRRVRELEEKRDRAAPSDQLTELLTQIHWARTELADAQTAEQSANQRWEAAERWLSADLDVSVR